MAGWMGWGCGGLLICALTVEDPAELCIVGNRYISAHALSHLRLKAHTSATRTNTRSSTYYCTLWCCWNVLGTVACVFSPNVKLGLQLMSDHFLNLWQTGTSCAGIR